LRLNSGKTKILSSVEAHHYYRINENIALDKLEARLNDLSESIGNVNKYRNMISQAVNKGLKRGRFIDGNGEKILRRLINYSKRYRVKIDHESFSEILYNWPSCRRLILSWWYEYIKPEDYLGLINEFVVSGHIVDDVAFIDIAVAIVSARLPYNLIVIKLLNELIYSIDIKSDWGFYTSLWLMSKYGTEDELFQLVDHGEKIWLTNEHLSRTAASVYPGSSVQSMSLRWWESWRNQMFGRGKRFISNLRCIKPLKVLLRLGNSLLLVTNLYLIK
jgi:hypothetical protein